MYSAPSAAPAIVRPSAKTANSEITSPRVHPAPQWLTSMAIVAHHGRSGSLGGTCLPTLPAPAAPAMSSSPRWLICMPWPAAAAVGDTMAGLADMGGGVARAARPQRQYSATASGPKYSAVIGKTKFITPMG